MARWVQHISGQGEKWEIDTEHHYYNSDLCWQVPNKTKSGGFFYLPKSEYTITDPPERWEKCTWGMIEIAPIARQTLNGLWTGTAGTWLTLPDGYRWARQGDALVIERKVEG